MTDIFISYSRRDVEVAKILSQTLEALGYTVWWDMTGLHGGQTFAKVIQQKLSEAKCAIVLWSPDSVASQWVHAEASFADKRGILLTAMYRESEAPMPFNNRHNENLRGWAGNIFDEDFQKLLEAVERLCPIPSGQPRHAELKEPERVETPAAKVAVPTVEEIHAETVSKPTSEPRETIADKPVIPRQPVDEKLSAAIPSNPPEPTATDGLNFGLVKKLLAGTVALGIAAYWFIPKWINHSPAPAQSTTQTVAPSTTQADKPVISSPKEKPVLPAVPVSADLLALTKASLTKARTALDKNRLTTPKNDSVWFHVGNVLNKDPNNAEAHELLSIAISRYHRWAETATARQQFKKAEAYLNLGGELITEFSLNDAALSQKQTQLFKALQVAKEAANKVYRLPNNLTLLPIPVGSFMMGSDDGSDDEKPVRKVTIAKPFWMSETEITFDQYDAYATATGKDKPYDRGWGRGNRPVINVSWQDAQGYVTWLSQNNKQGLQCRLPSEAEWEYAARAGTTTAYYWGDKPDRNFANYGKEECCGGLAEGHDKWVYTAPVKQFKPNGFGLYDMSGNVWEWVQDRWHDDYKGAPQDGSAWETGSAPRVFRGGLWVSSSNSVRSAFRSKYARNYFSVGIRVVCSPIDR